MGAGVVYIISLFLLLGSTLFGASLIEAEAGYKGDTITLQLRFDTPFFGEISKKQSPKKLHIELHGAHLPYTKKIQSAETTITLKPRGKKSTITISPPVKPTALTISQDHNFTRLAITIHLAQPSTANDDPIPYWILLAAFGILVAWILSKVIGSGTQPNDTFLRIRSNTFEGVYQKITKRLFKETVPRPQKREFHHEQEEMSSLKKLIEEYKKKASGTD
jgi:hypothetical protein